MSELGPHIATRCCDELESLRRERDAKIEALREAVAAFGLMERYARAMANRAPTNGAAMAALWDEAQAKIEAARDAGTRMDDASRIRPTDGPPRALAAASPVPEGERPDDPQERVEWERRQLIAGRLSPQDAEDYLKALELESAEIADREVELRVAAAPVSDAKEGERCGCDHAATILRLEDENEKLRAIAEAAGKLLLELDEWDVMNSTADGPFFKAKIAAVLAALSAEGSEEQ